MVVKAFSPHHPLLLLLLLLLLLRLQQRRHLVTLLRRRIKCRTKDDQSTPVMVPAPPLAQQHHHRLVALPPAPPLQAQPQRVGSSHSGGKVAHAMPPQLRIQHRLHPQTPVQPKVIAAEFVPWPQQKRYVGRVPCQTASNLRKAHVTITCVKSTWRQILQVHRQVQLQPLISRAPVIELIVRLIRIGSKRWHRRSRE